MLLLLLFYALTVHARVFFNVFYDCVLCQKWLNTQVHISYISLGLNNVAYNNINVVTYYSNESIVLFIFFPLSWMVTKPPIDRHNTVLYTGSLFTKSKNPHYE